MIQEEPAHPPLPFVADEVLLYLPRGSRDLETLETLTRIAEAHAGYLTLDEAGERGLDDDEPGSTLARAHLPPADIVTTYRRLEQIQDQLLQAGVPAIVQPNWLVGGLSSPPTGGSGAGPGARPLPVAYESLPLDPALVEPLRQAADKGHGTVRLVVMDAWNRDVAEVEAYLSHDPLLRALNRTCWDEGPPLVARPLPPNPNRTSQDDDPFPMPDHGNFVAYLASAVIGGERLTLHESAQGRASQRPDGAGRISIEAWRVLNEEGVGDSARLTYALQALAATTRPGERVIVNLSLVTMIPDIPLPLWRSGYRLPTWPPLPTERFVRGLPTNDPPAAERLDLVLYQAIVALADKGVLLVAAAGNSSRGDDERHLACYPAAYDEVRSVTAAAYDGHSEAWYANCAAPGGVALYGGDVGADDLVLTDRMVVGPFTDSTVPILGAGLDPANLTGAVAWAGTSFATPLASALAALLWAADPEATAEALWSRLCDLADGREIGGHRPVPYIPLLKYEEVTSAAD